MDRVEILCLRSQLRDMTTTLQSEGLLHVEEVPLAVENAPDFLRRAHPDPAQTQALFRLEELDRLLRESEPLLTVRPNFDEVAAAARRLPELDSDTSLDQARVWSEELRNLARDRAQLRDSIEVLTNYRQMLENITPVLGSRNVRLGHGARAVILQGDVARAVAQLESGLKDSLGDGKVEVISQLVGKKTLAVMILYPENEDAAVTQVLQDQGINPMDLPDKSLGGLSPRDVIGRIDKTVESQRRQLEEDEQKLDAASRQHGAALTAMQRVVADRLSEIKVVDSFAESELIAVIQGWAPHSDLPRLNEAVERGFGGKAHLSVLPLDDVDRKQVPTLLYNSKWFRPFEVLLKLFKPPTYGTIDPSAMVGIAFLLFYGFIVGDIGYGLMIILFGFWLKKKFGRNQLAAYAGTVAKYAGVSTCVFGLIYGEFFGDLPERFLHIHPIFHRAHYPTQMLVLAILVGVVHIYMSLIISIFENFRLGHKHHGEEKLGMLIGLTGVLLGVGGAALFPALTTVAVVLALILLVIAGIVLFKAAKWFMPLHMLEIISLVANIVSYSRLMALGVAGIALADLANSMLGGSGLGLLVGIIGAALVHLFNLAISMFSPMLHSLRLNYVEFLSKFYAPEGKKLPTVQEGGSMVTVSSKKMAVLALAMIAGAMIMAPAAFGQEAEAAAAGNLTVGDGLRALGLALGSGIAIAGSALATGRVQAAVGAGGTGALAEKPDLFTLILILIAIPETLVVFGFVISFLLYGAI